MDSKKISREKVERFIKLAKEKGYTEEEIKEFLKKRGIEIEKKSPIISLSGGIILTISIILTLVIFLYLNNTKNVSQQTDFNAKMEEIKNGIKMAYEMNHIIPLDINDCIFNSTNESKNKECVKVIMISIKDFISKNECSLELNQSEMYLLGIIEKNNFLCKKLTSFNKEDLCKTRYSSKEIKEKYITLLNNTNIIQIKVFCVRDSYTHKVFYYDTKNKTLIFG